MRPARPDSAPARPSRLVLALLLLLGGTFVFAGQGVVPIIVDGGLAAYAIGLALALMALDESSRTGGWGFGWDVAFFVLMLTGVWVPALVVSPALALLTRRR